MKLSEGGNEKPKSGQCRVGETHKNKGIQQHLRQHFSDVSLKV